MSATIGKAIYSILTSDEDVSAQVSTRVFPFQVPQGETLPAITFDREGSDHKEYRGGLTGLSPAIYSVSSFATRYSTVEALADLVKLAFYSVTLPGAFGGVTVRRIRIVSDSDEREVLTAGSEKYVYVVSQSYEIWADETTP